MPAFVRCCRIAEALPISRAHAYRLVQEGLLPPPVKLGERASAWIREELDAVMEARVTGAAPEAIRALVADLVAARNRPAPGARRRGTAIGVRGS